MELRPSISRSQVLALCWASVVFFNTYCVDFKFAHPEKSKKQYLAYSHFLRSLRSFRLIGYVPQLQSMMHAFAFAISSVFWVITLVLLFLYIAAVIATDFLGGQSRACDELGGGGEADDAHLDDMCLTSKNYRFGTVLQSMSVLFNVLTLDGWLDLVQDLSAGSYAPTWWSSTPFNTSVWSFLVRGEGKGGRSLRTLRLSIMSMPENRAPRFTRFSLARCGASCSCSFGSARSACSTSSRRSLSTRSTR